MTGESARADQPGGGGAAAPRLRHDWLDALKGVGIIAVVAGHVWTRGVLRDAMYSFHMPLFFMASGAVARAVPMRLLASRLAIGLGLPFISFTGLLIAADFLIEGLRGVRPIFPSVTAGVATILTATETLRGPFGILWFVPCLLAARLAWNGLLGIGGSTRAGIVALVMIGIAGLAWAADAYGGHSPLGLLPMPVALLLIWIGSLWRDWRPSLVMAIGLAVLALAALFWFPPLNLRAGNLGWPVASLAGAVAITDRLGWALRLLPATLLAPLIWIGRRSLVIMFTHLAFVHYLAPCAAPILLFVAGLTGAVLIDALARLTRPGRVLLLGDVR